MESSLKSRKRKQRPLNSAQLGSIFTRSRSQIYVHKTRSGHIRPDCNRTRHLINSEINLRKKLVVKLEECEAVVDQITSQNSVKDLRTRRVFSPATITDNDDDDVNIGDDDVDDDLKGESEIVRFFDSVRENDDCNKKIDGSSLGAESEVIVDLSVSDSVSVNKNDVMEADDVVQNESISVVNKVVDTKVSMSKSHSSVRYD